MSRRVRFPRRAFGARRRGFSLAELIIALAIIGIVLGLGLRGLAAARNGGAARAGAAEVRAAFNGARALAVRRGERAAVRIDTLANTVAVHIRTDTVLQRPLFALYRVRLSTTRDSASYGATGLGYGSSNLRVLVRRGAAVETVTVARLGRVR